MWLRLSIFFGAVLIQGAKSMRLRLPSHGWNNDSQYLATQIGCSAGIGKMCFMKKVFSSTSLTVDKNIKYHFPVKVLKGTRQERTKKNYAPTKTSFLFTTKKSITLMCSLSLSIINKISFKLLTLSIPLLIEILGPIIKKYPTWTVKK